MARLLLLLSTALLLSSCSLSFKREWNAALETGPGNGVEGAWEGTWTSEASGHHGRLRCVVGPSINNQGDHSFHYHATWGGILSGAYRTRHHVTRQKAGYTFKGQHQMPGWAGGLYTYDGTVKSDEFKAAYECAKDYGRYEMKRVRGNTRN
ncbi:MAG TPA: hypothetical protein VGE29_02615 [Prosthecobacter sp.]